MARQELIGDSSIIIFSREEMLELIILAAAQLSGVSNPKITTGSCYSTTLTNDNGNRGQLAFVLEPDKKD